MRQLVQFSVDVQTVSVRACVREEREAIRAWHDHVPSGVVEQRPDLLTAVKKEFERGDARTADGSVSRWVAWMCRRTFRECLRQQVGAIGRVDEGKRC